MTRAFRVVLIVAIAVALAPLTPRAQESSGLGHVVFETSGAAAAKPAFMRGVLLLHSFEYADAKDAFVEAQRIDPTFAMAYWGEAMTYNHPLWAQQDADAARAALARLAPTPAGRLAKAPTAYEKGWLTAVDALYGEGDKVARDLAYAAAMQRLFDSRPGDLEAASFCALALLGTSHNGRDFATYMKAAAIVERVYATNPQHPGAVHYLIHAYDDPVHAPLGMRAADAYAKVAPSASHALHMPSHIYFALGLWDEATAMNERSWRAADERVQQKKLSVDERGFHALHWLEYAYLQAGRYQDATRVLQMMEADAATSGSSRTRSHLALMRAAWLVETRQWSSAGQPVSSQSLGAEATSADLFAIGYAAVESGDLARAKAMLGQIRSAFGGSTDGDAHHAGMPQAGLPAAGGSANSRVPAVIAQQLDGVILLKEGQRESALERLTAAARAEDGLSFEFGPPNPVKPAHELLGEALLAVGHAQAARTEFEASLRRAPRRALSMFGLARAAARSGDTATAQATYAEIARMWKAADKTLPEWKELSQNEKGRPTRDGLNQAR
jgi:tetratricopeptide (TPR) repeat protein